MPCFVVVVGELPGRYRRDAAILTGTPTTATTVVILTPAPSIGQDERPALGGGIIKCDALYASAQLLLAFLTWVPS